MSCCLAAESALGGSSFVDREKRDGGEAGGVSGSEQPLPITKGNGNPSLCSCTLLFQMTLYLTFPVAMFWIANQATWFEDYVIERKMTLYLTFPVAMFWIANQATWFEDYVIERKRELWPPEKESQGTVSRGPSGVLIACSVKDGADPSGPLAAV
ncbi:hypothetical protein TREES_T100020099 [Tupaia chinensis]|uniref:Uncharacterized protein n=1 Tax=Tupaia chinensis TaxID=246437 RepID=L8Y4P4_TUPCH|nr:hypothetical protein TREES_T100020099 [Tupaia chinensis]